MENLDGDGGFWSLSQYGIGVWMLEIDWCRTRCKGVQVAFQSSSVYLIYVGKLLIQVWNTLVAYLSDCSDADRGLFKRLKHLIECASKHPLHYPFGMSNTMRLAV